MQVWTTKRRRGSVRHQLSLMNAARVTVMGLLSTESKVTDDFELQRVVHVR